MLQGKTTVISLDRDYLALRPYLEAECARRGVGFAFEELNPGGWGDAMFVGYSGIHNIEIKQAGEFIADIDHCIEQVKAQSGQSDFMWLFVYGEMEPAEDGNSYSFTEKHRLKTFESGATAGITKFTHRRHHRINYQGARKVLWRFREVGVQVIEVRDLAELAFELVTLYECSQNEGSTFSRLIVEKIRISETDPARAAFMKTLMGIQGAGIGEEVADAIADGMARREFYWNLSELMAALRTADSMMDKWPLRSGKRTIGPAAVVKLRTALGM